MGLTEILTILGIVAAAFVAYFIAKKRGYYEDLVFELVIACVPLGILGGRLGYFLEDITSPVGQKMWSVAAFFGVTGRAGLSLYGEILGAAAGAFILSLVNSRLMAKNPEKYHYRKVNFVQMFDVVLCVLPLGLSCMSLGNAAESGGFFTSVHFYAFLWYAASEALLLWLYAGKRKRYPDKTTLPAEPRRQKQHNRSDDSYNEEQAAHRRCSFFAFVPIRSDLQDTLTELGLPQHRNKSI